MSKARCKLCGLSRNLDLPLMENGGRKNTAAECNADDQYTNVSHVTSDGDGNLYLLEAKILARIDLTRRSSTVL